MGPRIGGLTAATRQASQICSHFLLLATWRTIVSFTLPEYTENRISRQYSRLLFSTHPCPHGLVENGVCRRVLLLDDVKEIASLASACRFREVHCLVGALDEGLHGVAHAHLRRIPPIEPLERDLHELPGDTDRPSTHAGSDLLTFVLEGRNRTGQFEQSLDFGEVVTQERELVPSPSDQVPLLVESGGHHEIHIMVDERVTARVVLTVVGVLEVIEVDEGDPELPIRPLERLEPIGDLSDSRLTTEDPGELIVRRLTLHVLEPLATQEAAVDHAARGRESAGHPLGRVAGGPHRAGAVEREDELLVPHPDHRTLRRLNHEQSIRDQSIDLLDRRQPHRNLEAWVVEPDELRSSFLVILAEPKDEDGIEPLRHAHEPLNESAQELAPADLLIVKHLFVVLDRLQVRQPISKLPVHLYLQGCQTSSRHRITIHALCQGFRLC